MLLNYERIMTTKEELEKIDRSNPQVVVGALIHVLCNYNNLDTFYEMLQYLMGEYQEISPMMKQNINDRMSQNNKSTYI